MKNITVMIVYFCTVIDFNKPYRGIIIGNVDASRVRVIELTDERNCLISPILKIVKRIYFILFWTRLVAVS